MKRKLFSTLLILMLFAGVGSAMAQGEEPALTLRLDRNFGYGGFGKIQGRFTLELSGADQLSSVEFFIDEDLMETIEQPPFKYRFHTGDYSPGRHTFSALGHTQDGSALQSNSISKDLLTSEDAWAETQQMLVPILILVGVFTLIGLAAPLLFKGGKKFQVGRYGPAGGAVCPRCALPFSRHYLAPNLVVGKLERCPHCGKWSIVPRASATKLQEAETRYQPEKPQIAMKEPSGENLKELLEESRFED